MTKLAQTKYKKQWYCNLKNLLNESMLDDINEKYGDEMDEAIARILLIIDHCQREEEILPPEMAAGALFAILVECGSFENDPEFGDILDYGYILAKDKASKN